MATRNLEITERDAALMLHGLLELSAKLDRAESTASRSGDEGGMRTIGAGRAAIGDLYDRVRRLHLGDSLPSLASATRAVA